MDDCRTVSRREFIRHGYTEFATQRFGHALHRIDGNILDYRDLLGE